MRLFLGTLLRGGLFVTSRGRYFLTPVRAGESRATPLAVPEDLVGQRVLVSGVAEGEILYEARLLEALPPISERIIEHLLEKGEASLKDLEALCLPETRRLCALVIGHKKASPGAVNPSSGLTEFAFNDELSRLIEQEVQGVDVQRVYRRTYETLPHDINALSPDFIVSLHCNAFDRRASGTEVLYYHRSSRGKRLAEIVLKHLVNHLRLPNRGLKPCTAEDRGGYLLRYTKAPCVIAEPFFIDNDEDLARAQEDTRGLARAYARAVEEAARVL